MSPAQGRFDELRTRLLAFGSALFAVFLGTSLTCFAFGMRGAPSMRDFFAIRGVVELQGYVGVIPGIVGMFLLFVAAASALVVAASLKSFAARIFESLVSGFLLSVLLGTLGSTEGGSAGLALGQRLAATISLPVASTLCAVASVLALSLVIEGNLRDLAGVRFGGGRRRPRRADAAIPARETASAACALAPASISMAAPGPSMVATPAPDPDVRIITERKSDFRAVDLRDIEDAPVRLLPRKRSRPELIDASPTPEPPPDGDGDDSRTALSESPEPTGESAVASPVPIGIDGAGPGDSLDRTALSPPVATSDATEASHPTANVVGDAPPSVVGRIDCETVEFTEPSETVERAHLAEWAPADRRSDPPRDAGPEINEFPTASVGLVNNADGFDLHDDKQVEIHETQAADAGVHGHPVEFGLVRPAVDQQLESSAIVVEAAEGQGHGDSGKAGDAAAHGGFAPLAAAVLEYDHYSREVQQARGAEGEARSEVGAEPAGAPAIQLQLPEVQTVAPEDWDLPRTIPEVAAPAPPPSPAKAPESQLELFPVHSEREPIAVAEVPVASEVAAEPERKSKGRNRRKESAQEVKDEPSPVAETQPETVAEVVVPKDAAPVEAAPAPVPFMDAAPTEVVPDVPTVTGAVDLFLDRAARIVISQKRASISFLQRKLGISLGDAQHVMAALEKEGVVGPYRGTPSRDILLDLVQWDARRNST